MFIHTVYVYSQLTCEIILFSHVKMRQNEEFTCEKKHVKITLMLLMLAR